MHNIKLTIAYDGTHYLGWQKTSAGPSIEAALQPVIEKMLQHPISLQAASRTDAGVHAKGQVVNFLTSKPQLDLNKFRAGLHRIMPSDITILKAEEMPLSFHPTLDCLGKEYRYFVSFGPIQLPHHRFYSWHVPHALHLDAMRQALPSLTGRHDFAAFCNVQKSDPYTDYVREIQLLEILKIDDQRLLFRIQGNHFLYKMVRNLVGTLIAIGRGKFPADALSKILESRYRPEAGVTAPAHGLFLNEVFY